MNQSQTLSPGLEKVMKGTEQRCDYLISPWYMALTAIVPFSILKTFLLKNNQILPTINAEITVFGFKWIFIQIPLHYFAETFLASLAITKTSKESTLRSDITSAQRAHDFIFYICSVLDTMLNVKLMRMPKIFFYFY